MPTRGGTTATRTARATRGGIRSSSPTRPAPAGTCSSRRGPAPAPPAAAGGSATRTPPTPRRRGGGGVIGYAYSADLVHWEVRPPLTAPAGFHHLEVPQTQIVDGQPVLIFS